MVQQKPQLSQENKEIVQELHAVIVAGGEQPAWIINELQTADIIIGADRGALFLVGNGIKPTLSLGDFDSVNEHEKQFIKENSNRMLGFDEIDKDYTDTELALQYAMQYGAKTITIYGATGTRLDHTLASIHLLRQTYEAGIRTKIVDEHNSIQLTGDYLEISKERYTYMSLIPLSMSVTGIFLEGFVYPLTDATLTIGQSLGVSNRWEAECGTIKVKSGLILIICSRD
ncbi:thiamine diphosphokinase [Paenibacillus sp. SC116]|uniref:thiamine diphosphokinase n=1 Tax=Paenibacillus sp. SC116 TaxID=2968986 RepID=UPI00215A7EA0|nr:thiamine diphosphokinase [Paenibacillus sp. SC116]MCR8842792.1 thiamine diphosphokinase [Paenibacillus sp. SC116]